MSAKTVIFSFSMCYLCIQFPPFLPCLNSSNFVLPMKASFLSIFSQHETIVLVFQIMEMALHLKSSNFLCFSVPITTYKTPSRRFAFVAACDRKTWALALQNTRSIVPWWQDDRDRQKQTLVPFPSVNMCSWDSKAQEILQMYLQSNMVMAEAILYREIVLSQ